MLCADTLAELAASFPPLHPAGPPSVLSTDEESTGASVVSTGENSSVDSSVDSRVGEARAAHSKGHTDALNAVEKWVLAALRKLDAKAEDLVLRPSLEPNDVLASRMIQVFAEWVRAGTIARDAGVVVDGVACKRAHLLDHRPPDNLIVRGCNWMQRYINQTREGIGLKRALPKDWARDLAGRAGETRQTNALTTERKTKDGSIYRTKHDLAPTPEQLTAMTRCALTGDFRVHAGLLDAVEAGMALSLYMPTGARGGELKKMHLQSLRIESIPHPKTGKTFECIKLTAFQTKTAEQHLNQFLPHSNPWQCGVGALGLSILLRVKAHGPPPFDMRTDEASWFVLGSSAGTLDARLKKVFNMAALRRQLNDPLTYLGRHFGTRSLQHGGGSAQGGAARRGHSSDGTASHAYTECPLLDMLLLAGNFSDDPFEPAHHSPELWPLADAVILLLFPQLAAHEAAVDARQREVDVLKGGRAEKVRTEEQLLCKELMARAIRYTCRMALVCLVARPRTWRKWAILENESSIWRRAFVEGQRVVVELFGASAAARAAMEALAKAVEGCERAEVEARRLSPEHAVSTALTDVVRGMDARAEAREKRLQEENREMLRQILTVVAPERASPPPQPPQPPPPPTLQPSTFLPTPLQCCKPNRPRVEQHDVEHFSTWWDMSKALRYARDALVPLERAKGAKWRIFNDEHGVEKKALDKQWRAYKTLAIAVGLEGAEAVQRRFDALGARPHTKFLDALRAAHKSHRDTESVAKRVLGY